MNSAQVEIQLLASLVAVACALPGVFLVLRKMALISDAISHAILPGIVIGFFMTGNLNSPILIIFAALTGILTVALVNLIQKTKLVGEDTAIGLVFPALFSIGVILISKNARDVHIDIDAVLLGELAFTPFDRWQWLGTDMGPKSIWVMGIILIMSIILLYLFFKELKLSTFDPGLAASLGISPVIIHYALMSVSSVTIVGAFDAVGAILVVALMIGPAAIAYLLTDDLKTMIGLSIFFGVLSAIGGYWMAHWLDASISGSMTTVLGFIFMMVYLFAPGKGYISAIYRRKQQKVEVSLLTFLLHINNHVEESERHINHLSEYISWNTSLSESVIKKATESGLIVINKQIISLTENGKNFTEKALEYITTNKDDNLGEFFNKFEIFKR